MIQIAVPDWVAEIATEAYSALPARTTFHDSMKAAITAALGAWVVPTACAEPWRIDYLNSYPQNSVDVSTLDTLSAGDITLYTLRQEKPE